MTKVESDCCNNESRDKIPWLVNGTLSQAEVTRVEAHLAICSQCQEDLELHTAMQAAALGRELTPMLPATNSADIIGGRNQPNRPARRRLAVGSIAAAASIAVLGLAMGMLYFMERGPDGSNQIFETATSPGAAAHIDYVLQVQFEDDVSVEQRDIIVQQLEGALRWSVTDLGAYEVHVQLAAPTLATLELYEERASQLTGVRAAEFTALQLPMR